MRYLTGRHIAIKPVEVIMKHGDKYASTTQEILKQYWQVLSQTLSDLVWMAA